MKILILGGYGVFGGRLAELLSDIAEAHLLICGRNGKKATDFCKLYQGNATVTPVEMDRSAIAKNISNHQPDIVVDASGPFQNYGDDPYIVVKACIKAKVSYLDFADAADFVFGISQFDNEAKKAGIFVLSGVSSFPVLTAAVLREISNDMTIRAVTGGIAPSPYAGIGLNVMRAVVGYAGGPVKLLRNGQFINARGLTESRRYTVAPPGHMPLRNLRFSLVDVPDLQVIPTEHSALKDIWMGAGPVPESLHRILNLLAKLRAVFNLPSFAVFSPVFYRVLNLMKFGEHRGGMFVHATGLKEGKPIEKSWHLLAEGDDGPFIPSMAIEALVRKILAGDVPDNGARPATRALSLADYEKLFEGRTIYTGFRSSDEPAGPLYRHILGHAFDGLPDQLRTLHNLESAQTWEGTAQVRRGKNLLAKLIASVIGFPKEADKTPVQVTLTPEKDGERWVRNFDGKIFNSFQSPGRGRDIHLLWERFGVITIALALVIKDEQLYLIPRSWKILGLPLPKLLLPAGNSFEEQVDGKFRFNVEIKAPIIGLIVSYKGVLNRTL